MSEKVRLGIAVTHLLAETGEGWVGRVLMVLESMDFSVDESKEALKLSGLYAETNRGDDEVRGREVEIEPEGAGARGPVERRAG